MWDVSDLFLHCFFVRDPEGSELFLRCLVPPARLISAAIWQMIQQDVPNYGLLEEFVSQVTETLPDLLSYRQKTQLTMGLRARVSKVVQNPKSS